MSKIGMWLVRNTEYCAETRNLIEDVIVAVQNRDYLSPATKKEILSEALNGMGFSTEQLAAFAKGGLPIESRDFTVLIDANMTLKFKTHAASREEAEEIAREGMKSACFMDTFRKEARVYDIQIGDVIEE